MEKKKNWKERLGGYDSMEGAMFVTIDEKTVYTIDELKEFIQQELDRAREEGKTDVDTFMDFLAGHNLVKDVHFYRGDGEREIIIKLN